LRENGLENKLKPPTLITGDLDSCDSESIDFFSKKETKVVKTLDQDETDFTKSLRVLEPFISELNLEFVVTICENSGRIDHILANINTLYKNLQKSPELSKAVYILSSGSLTWLIGPGQHTIHIPENLRKYWCSLVPVGSLATATTTGLKWNLNNDLMEFGGIVSTSNKYDGKSDKVTIENDSPLLWSMGIDTEN
jgi:thiamine pyrophosphokinase